METLDTTVARYALLLSPAVWDGTIYWLFRVDAPSDDVISDASFAGWVYFVAGVVTIAVARAHRPAVPADPGMTTAGEGPTIALEGVSRWYGNVVAVNEISFEVSPGHRTAGPNGVGKSTLLHMLSGFLKPSAGTVTVLGESPWGNPGLYRQLGLVPERESVYGG